MISYVVLVKKVSSTLSICSLLNESNLTLHVTGIAPCPKSISTEMCLRALMALESSIAQTISTKSHVNEGGSGGYND